MNCMKNIVEKALIESIARLRHIGTWSFDGEVAVSVERPKDLLYGDWTTNVCFILAKILRKSPFAVAQELSYDITQQQNYFSEVRPVQPGYVNFIMKRDLIVDEIRQILIDELYGQQQTLVDQTIMVEYTQPNPFKPFHIGHLMSNTIGESLSRIVEFCGARVVRANYQGDVGPHVAKSLWAIQKYGYDINNIEEIGTAYARGHEAYETDEVAKNEIHAINRSIYLCNDATLMQLYAIGRARTLERFEEIYAVLGTTFDVYYFESETWKRGEKVVRDHVGTIFEESDGAIIFDGEKYDLHKRVFITQQGLPTYEAKEIGLALIKKDTHPADAYLVTTAVEQEEYFKVVKKAIEMVEPSLSGKIQHIAHGMMMLTTGKMSSRKGNVITGETLIADAQILARQKISERADDHVTDQTVNAIAVAGIKFSILKQHIGKNVIYDPESALSFDGDSGPYLQYTYARCQSVLTKATDSGIACDLNGQYCDNSVIIERLLTQFPDVVARANADRAPHIISNFMIECARTFNAYYAHTIIVDNSNVSLSSYRIGIASAVARVIKRGLYLLGIPVVEKM